MIKFNFRFFLIFFIVAVLGFCLNSSAVERQTQVQRQNRQDSASSKKSDAPAKIKTPKNIRSEAGLNIPAWGVAIDAVYDPRLDDLIPGYKLLNVILTNRGASTIYLDPQKDKWSIRDNLDKLQTGFNHARQINEKIWINLPPGLKEKLEYPSAVRVGYSTKIDVLFPKSVDLSHFREIIWRSSHFQKEFNIFTMTGKDSDLEREEIIPNQQPSITYEQAREKYEGTPRKEPADTAGGVNDEGTQNGKSGKKRSPFDPDLDNLTIPMD